MIGKRLYKTYANLTSIVIRASDGTPEGKNHAVLVSAHLDSTLPSPGAAVDGALSVGIMLDWIRVLTHTPGWTPSHAIIFCKRPFDVFLPRPEFRIVFNHLEESLQESGRVPSVFNTTSHNPYMRPCTSNAFSMTFLTYNPSSIRAFINLEGGFRELYSLLFSYGVA